MFSDRWKDKSPQVNGSRHSPNVFQSQFVQKSSLPCIKLLICYHTDFQDSVLIEKNTNKLAEVVIHLT